MLQKLPCTKGAIQNHDLDKFFVLKILSVIRREWVQKFKDTKGEVLSSLAPTPRFLILVPPTLAPKLLVRVSPAQKKSTGGGNFLPPLSGFAPNP